MPEEVNRVLIDQESTGIESKHLEACDVASDVPPYGQRPVVHGAQ